MRQECSKLEIIRNLIDLSRIGFSDEEIEKLCEDMSKIESLLKQVSILGKIDIKPLYNVWDGILDPPTETGIKRIDINDLVPSEKIVQSKVKIPWRGE